MEDGAIFESLGHHINGIATGIDRGRGNDTFLRETRSVVLGGCARQKRATGSGDTCRGIGEIHLPQGRRVRPHIALSVEGIYRVGHGCDVHNVVDTLARDINARDVKRLG